MYHKRCTYLGWKFPMTMQNAIEMQPTMISQSPPALHFFESVKSRVDTRLSAQQEQQQQQQ